MHMRYLMDNRVGKLVPLFGYQEAPFDASELLGSVVAAKLRDYGGPGHRCNP